MQSLWLKKINMGQDHKNIIMVVLFPTPHDQLLLKQKPLQAKKILEINSEGIDKDYSKNTYFFTKYSSVSAKRLKIIHANYSRIPRIS